MRESSVEKKLVLGIKRLGGRAYKFVSPGNSGVPDRLIILPGGKIYFVELKTDTGKLSPLQRVQIQTLEGLGQDVRVLYGAEDVGDFLEHIKMIL